MAESLPDSQHTSIKARLDDLQGQPFVPVLAPELASELVLDVVVNEIGLQPAY
jgi:hypothetical protein